VDFLVGCIRFF